MKIISVSFVNVSHLKFKVASVNLVQGAVMDTDTVSSLLV